MTSERELDLREKEYQLAKDIASYRIKHEYNLQYLKLTVVIVLLIVVVFYITCKFNSSTESEGFSSSPQLTTNTYNQYRSDPQFDWYHL